MESAEETTAAPAETLHLASTNEETIEDKITETDTIKETRRQAKLRYHLKAGCGYGKKREKLLAAFWGIIWSGLEQNGWDKVVGVDRDKGSITFFLPGVDKTNKKQKKKGVDYYDRILDVIERVLEWRNDEEMEIAKAFHIQREKDEPSKKPTESGSTSRPRRTAALATTGRDASPNRKESPLPPLPRERPSLTGATLDLSWKDGGSLYPKRSSSIGEEYQATEIPAAGTYEQGGQSELYELIWDPKGTKNEELEELLEEKVPYNKKEQAMVTLGLMGLNTKESSTLNITKIVSQLSPIDGSDWTEEEKDSFHKRIFRFRKDMTALSKSIRKDLKTCLTYYLGTYKKSDQYRRLKTVCVDERYNLAASSVHGVDACAICGDGGSLLICDGCEGEYHMGCLRPQLKAIPEGNWECDECVDRKLLKAREYIIMNSGLYEMYKGNNKKRKAEDVLSGKDEDTDYEITAEDMVMRPSSPVLAKMKAFAGEINSVFPSLKHGTSENGVSSSEV